MPPRSTRRAFLGGLVSVTVGTVGSDDHGDWLSVQTPTDATLHDVVQATPVPVAVGADGVVLARGDDWRRVTTDGPGGDGRNLHGAATTDDRRRVWVAGASGALGAYDPEEGTVEDHSGPADVTNTFTDVAVAGAAGEETVLLTDGSGQVHVTGPDREWRTTTVGDGSALLGVDVSGPQAGHAVSASLLYATCDGDTWTPRSAARGSFTAVDSDGPETVFVATDGGKVLTPAGDGWNRRTVAPVPLRGVARCDFGCGHVLAVGDGGVVARRAGGEWSARSPADADLHAVVHGHPHVAVGAGGTVIER